MGRPRVYPDEFRERAVPLVREWREERGVRDGGVTAISSQLGVNRGTLRRWVIEQEVETGDRPGLTRAERSRIAEQSWSVAVAPENRGFVGGQASMRAMAASCQAIPFICAVGPIEQTVMLRGGGHP